MNQHINIEPPVKTNIFPDILKHISLFIPVVMQYRQVIANLVRRDLKIRYKGSILGIIWAFLNPLGTMLIFLFIFSYVAKFQTDEPYALFLLTAIIPWAFLANSLQKSVTILVDHSPMVKKVYFPREILPLSTVLAEMIHLLLGLFLLFILLLIVYPKGLVFIWLVPGVLLIQFMFTLGLCLFVAACNIFLKDTAQILSILLTFWYFLTPIFYPVTIIPKSLHYIYLINPAASIVTLYRYAMLGRNEYLFFSVIVSLLSAVIVLLFGYYYFKKYENTFVKLL